MSSNRRTFIRSGAAATLGAGLGFPWRHLGAQVATAPHLTAVTYDPASATRAGTLLTRRNFFYQTPKESWHYQRDTAAHPSLVVYARDALRDREVFLSPTLAWKRVGTRQDFFVRAVPANLSSASLFDPSTYLQVSRGPASSVEPITHTSCIQFSTRKLAKLPVGIYDFILSWELAETGDGPWKPFAQSRHSLLLTLDVPRLPWLQPSECRSADALRDNPHLPWTDIISIGLTWARGASTSTTSAWSASRGSCTISAGAWGTWTTAPWSTSPNPIRREAAGSNDECARL